MNKKEEYFEVLNIIDEKGNISMMTACKYLINMHELSNEEALSILNEWLEIHKENKLE